MGMAMAVELVAAVAGVGLAAGALVCVLVAAGCREKVARQGWVSGCAALVVLAVAALAFVGARQSPTAAPVMVAFAVAGMLLGVLTVVMWPQSAVASVGGTCVAGAAVLIAGSVMVA